MNANKKNIRWILCASKTYPGEFYYFNVATGETVWSLEAEKSFPKNTSINRIPGKSHCYPEPTSPQNSPSTSFVIPETFKRPEFGKKAEFTERQFFPNFIHQISSTKTACPTFGQSAFRFSSVEPYMPNIVWAPVQLPTPVYVNNAVDVTRKIDRDTQTVNRVDKETTELTNRFTNSVTLSMNINKVTNTPVSKLNNNDLRLFLLTKRRKSVDLGETEGFVAKKIKTYEEDHKVVTSTPKKRVTFNIEHQDNSDASDLQNMPSKEYEVNSHQLNLSTDLWYIMVDSDTLVEEYQLIEEYIQTDENCRLLLPRCLQLEIEKMCLGDCRGRQRVMVARQSARKLASPLPYIVTLPAIDISNNTEDVSDVLKYCLQVIKNGNELVFVTNSPKLFNDADLLNIPCIKTKDIKLENTIATPEITFDLKKIKFSISNERKQENIFLKPPSEFKPFMFEKNDHVPVVSFKTPLFKTKNKVSGPKTVDANTSPIRTDRLIDITRKKVTKTNAVTEGNLFCETAVSDININIQNLSISDLEKEPQSFKAIKEKEIKNKFEIQNATSSIEKKKVTAIEKDKSPEDDDATRCYIKNNSMEDVIRHRLDEWSCWFSQIIEDTLTQVLVRHKKVNDNFTSQWVLYDVVEGIKKLYGSNAEVQTLADNFTTMLIKEFVKGKLKSSMEPCDFVKLLECGSSLLQILKKHEPTYPELLDGEKSLYILLKEMKNPSEEYITQMFNTPVLSRSEVIVDSRMRRNYIKQPSEIIDYLKKHFDEWKNYEEPQEQENFHRQSFEENITGNLKILRTFGRNLKLLNIAGNKTITVRKTIETNHQENTGNTQEDKRTANTLKTTMEELNISVLSCNINKKRENIFKGLTMTDNDKEIPNREDFYLKTVESKNTCKNDETSNLENVSNHIVPTQSLDDSNIPKPGNTFGTMENKDGPKVIRNLKTIDIYKEKFRKNSNMMDGEALHNSDIQDETMESRNVSAVIEGNDNRDNYSDISNGDAMSFVYKIKPKNAKIDTQNIDVKMKNNPAYDSVVNILMTNDVSAVKYDILDTETSTCKDESTNDSGFENESIHAHSFAKTFLSELSSSFMSIHGFIVQNTTDFKEDRIEENQKKYLYTKVNKLLNIIAAIIVNLQRIIQRESNDNTALKAMLSAKAFKDKRMTRYRMILLTVDTYIEGIKLLLQCQAKHKETNATLVRSNKEVTPVKSIILHWTKQVVTKCLEQARILENTLKIMLNLTGDDCDGSISTCTIDTNLRYLNIFE